ncbi:SGNH hydrolase-type esterase domain-containing protein [Ephemerocybe angulata]|uniref:SGNH hydrolase-type esterase domain-containing protein n=1 Tax=Ephemerocybe angulata TaxID=980116 RepID=A0A8H6ICD6_9AGAR|nr:SGNH hydrolase-type esterase domain-containing protein [Tulosesus angulatus]
MSLDDLNDPVMRRLRTRRLSLPNLQTLILRRTKTMELLDYLETPILANMDVGFYNVNALDTQFSPAIFTNFLDSSRCIELKCLSLRECHVNAEDLSSIIGRLPYLRRLTLEKFQVLPKERFWASLIPDPMTKTGPLPLLETLEILSVPYIYSPGDDGLYQCMISRPAFLPNVLAFSGKVCRIMPLGASITFGVGSSQGNGYRDDLYNLLEQDGNTVNMVGNNPATQSTFKDKDTEGWPGFVIDQVYDKMSISMPTNRPNIATILVGTNDMTQNLNVDGAPGRLSRLIRGVLDFPPLTLVVVSTLPPNANAGAQQRILNYNAAIPGVVQQFVNEGRSVVFADCGRMVGIPDLVDGTHPNDAAYERIGRCFYEAILYADTNGWIFPVQGPAP